MERNTRKATPPQFQVIKVFPQRDYLCIHRLVKPVAFTCNRYSLGKTSKLVRRRPGFWHFEWNNHDNDDIPTLPLDRIQQYILRGIEGK